MNHLEDLVGLLEVGEVPGSRDRPEPGLRE